jgi:hypothetical protein
MRKLFKILILITCFGFVLSCSDDDDIQSTNNSSSGSWYLRNVSGGIAGINIDYSQNEVKWTFESSDSTLEVVNNIISTGPESIYAGPQSGTYSYSIQTIDGNERLFVDSENKGVMLIQNDSLFLDDGVAADGMMHLFVR